MDDNYSMKRIIISLMLSVLVTIFALAESMHSPSWGFFLDLPEGYTFTDGDGKNRFSFSGPAGLMFDLVIYDSRYESVQDLVIDINRRISNNGEADFFMYHDKRAAIMELNFDNFSGYGLCIELAENSSAKKPMMAALSYGPSNLEDMDLFHLSALDSIAPSVSERLTPGPIMHYSFPRGSLKNVTLSGGISAMIYENDAEASQVLIEREFAVLAAYINTDYWQKAWFRYYRFVFRDSFDRVVNPALALVRAWGGTEAKTNEAKRAFAERALKFVQGFKYERYPDGSDFINLVSAITEERGSCDSHSMLWAIILTCADIRAGIMISRQYSHAMGMADIAGAGARFDAFGVRWLVAETTADVDLGLIAQDISDPQHWIGVMFE
ncbi:MAG: hypothetical protein LBU88_07215 [Treponema sp.]|jgi:hypothetical protein|nr:hypothetical protein [Treponema sp.]